MKIENYDVKKSVSESRRLNDILSKYYRMSISGPSNCGKMNTLMNILRKPLVYYDKCYIYTSNPQQDKIQDFMKLTSEISKKLGYNPLQIDSGGDIRDVKDYPQNNRKVVVFDDLKNANDKIQGKIANNFTNGRHQRISPIYLGQSHYDIPKKLRLNCSHVILYEPHDPNHIQLLSREFKFNPLFFGKLINTIFSLLTEKRKLLKKILMKN